MKKVEIRTAPSENLIRRYEELAAARGAELQHGSVKAANRIFLEQATIRRELGRRGPADLRLLLPLLKSENPWVRLAAAVPALFFAPEAAVQVLEQVATEPKGLGFDAQMTLEQWRKGELRPSWRQ